MLHTMRLYVLGIWTGRSGQCYGCQGNR